MAHLDTLRVPQFFKIKFFIAISLAIILPNFVNCYGPKCINNSTKNDFRGSYPSIRVSNLVAVSISSGDGDVGGSDHPGRTHAPALRNWKEMRNGKVIIPSFAELVRFECSAKYRVQWGFQSIPWVTWDTWTSVIRPVNENDSVIYSASIEFHRVQETSLQPRIPICYSVTDPCIQTAVVTHSIPGNNVEITFEEGSNYGIDSKSDKDVFGMNQNCTLKFGYDPKSQKFYCQETNPESKASGKIFLRACSDPVSCDSLLAKSNCSAQPSISISECTMENHCRKETAEAGKFPGIAVCHIGGGVPEHSAAIPYFSSLASTGNKSSSRYLNWEDANPTEMLQLSAFHKPIYTHEKVSFMCNASYYYLGSGMYFNLTRLTNNSSVPITTTPAPRVEDDSDSNSSSGESTSLEDNGNGEIEEEFDLDLDHAKESVKKEDANIAGISTKMPVLRTLEVTDFAFLRPGKYELSCNAPIWNSTKWAHKSITFIIKESLIPEFDGGNMSVRQYYAPYKRLECVAFGVPKPELTWTRDGGSVSDEITLITGEQNQTVWSILVFPKLEYGIYGNFTCSASNVAGTARKTFAIIPTDKSSSLGLFIFVGLAIVISILIPLILFLIWKVRRQKRFIEDLTQEEVDVFINGKPEYIPFQCDMSTYAYYLPYDTSYEIPREALEIDLEKILGSGEYGLVVYGLYKNANPPGGGPPVVKSVAVKTTKSLTSGKEYFKALLSELKIMTYIGSHENIVNLVGACTTNIKKREVYIATDYCENGSLLAYLRVNRYAVENPSFYTELAHSTRLSSLAEENSLVDPVNLIPKGGRVNGVPIDVQYVRMEDLGNIALNPQYENIRTIKQHHLFQWSLDVARGMEFLSSKKVIHGDLAARNVLLTRNLTAKICDFGLSRQLYHYTYYTKTAVTPLPLKWLAIESLQNFQFSIESDVWAYGVTLYEIFTVGEIPYSSIQMNGEEFLRALKHGMRLSKPVFAPMNVFEVMMKCWRHDKKQRPSFTDLVQFFEPLVSILTGESFPLKSSEVEKSGLNSQESFNNDAMTDKVGLDGGNLDVELKPHPKLQSASLKYANLPVVLDREIDTR